MKSTFLNWSHTNCDRNDDDSAYVNQITTTDFESSNIVFDYFLIHVRHACVFIHANNNWN